MLAFTSGTALTSLRFLRQRQPSFCLRLKFEENLTVYSESNGLDDGIYSLNWMKSKETFLRVICLIYVEDVEDHAFSGSHQIWLPGLGTFPTHFLPGAWHHLPHLKYYLCLVGSKCATTTTQTMTTTTTNHFLKLAHFCLLLSCLAPVGTIGLLCLRAFLLVAFALHRWDFALYRWDSPPFKGEPSKGICGYNWNFGPNEYHVGTKMLLRAISFLRYELVQNPNFFL